MHPVILGFFPPAFLMVHQQTRQHMYPTDTCQFQNNTVHTSIYLTLNIKQWKKLWFSKYLGILLWLRVCLKSMILFISPCGTTLAGRWTTTTTVWARARLWPICGFRLLFLLFSSAAGLWGGRWGSWDRGFRLLKTVLTGFWERPWTSRPFWSTPVTWKQILFRMCLVRTTYVTLSVQQLLTSYTFSCTDKCWSYSFTNKTSILFAITAHKQTH